MAPKPTGHQLRFAPQWTFTDETLATLHDTISKDDKAKALIADIGDYPRALDWYQHQGSAITKALEAKETANILLKNDLLTRRANRDKFKQTKEIARSAVERGENSERLQEIDDFGKEMWDFIREAYAEEIAMEKGIPPQQRNYLPEDEDVLAYLRQSASVYGKAETKTGFDPKDICDMLLDQVSVAQRRLRKSDDSLKEEKARADRYDSLSRTKDEDLKKAQAAHIDENATLRAEHEQAMAQVMTQSEERQARIDELNAEVQNLTNRMAEPSEQETKLQTELQQAQTELERLRDVAEEVNGLKEKILELNKAREKAEVDRKEADAVISGLEEDAREAVAAVMERNNKLSAELDEVKAANEDEKEALRKTWSDALQSAQEQMIRFFRKTLRFIVLKDIKINDWRINDLDPLAGRIPFISAFRPNTIPVGSIQHPSNFADSFTAAILDPPSSDFACLLVTSLDKGEWWSNNKSLPAHLLWLDQIVMPQFMSGSAALNELQKMMLACLLSHLREIAYHPASGGISSYWAATLLVRLTCQWELQDPYMLVGGQTEDFESLPLLRAAGHLRLRMMAGLTFKRPLRLSDALPGARLQTEVKIKEEDGATGQPSAFQHVPAAGQNVGTEFVSSGTNDGEEGDGPNDESLPAVDKRFKSRIEQFGDSCVLAADDFLRTVCPAPIVGVNDEWYITADNGNFGLTAVARGLSACYFLKTPDGTIFTTDPFTVDAYDSVRSGTGRLSWQYEAGGLHRRCTLDFTRGDNLYQFVESFAPDQLRAKVHESNDTELREHEARMAAILARSRRR